MTASKGWSLEETVGKNGTVITDYQYEQNNYSDSQFLKDSLERNGVQEEETTLVADGAYSGKENRDLAVEKNIRLLNTNLNGKPVDDILADFVFTEDGTSVLKCPARYESKSCGYTFMETEEYRNLFKIRNGVETMPSMLRRQYHVDEMPVRSLIRGRFFFGCKIGALNFKKLFTYRKGLGHYAPNPVLT